MLEAEGLPRSGTVVAWGDNRNGQTDLPDGLADVTQVAAGGGYSVALKADGTVVVWGESQNEEVIVPERLSGVVRITPGLAVKSDGTVVDLLERDVPSVPPDLGGVTQTADARFHCLAVRDDGSVIAWGDSDYTYVPAGLTGVVQVAIEPATEANLAVKNDGTVVTWECEEGAEPIAVVGLSDVVQIAARPANFLALKSDGTVVRAGFFGGGGVWEGVTDAVQVACGDTGDVVLRADGTVLGGSHPPPAGLDDVIYVAASRDSGSYDGAGHLLAIVAFADG